MTFKVPIVIAALVLASVNVAARPARKHGDDELPHVREAVWRAWFDGDTTMLEKIVPRESIVISGGEENWKKQSDVLRGAVEFHTGGGKLIRLQFPRTEIQHFGNVAIVWSSYELETEVAGRRSSESGRVTEIFVSRHGQWTNPGWHTDSTK